MTYTPKIDQLPAHIVEVMKKTNRSPCCDAPLIPGPRGGASRNFWCEACHARFNVLVDHPINWGECTDVKDDNGFASYTGKDGERHG